MLTATYTILAMDAERDKARSILGRLQQYVRTTWQGMQHIDKTFLENILRRITHFDQSCRRRKIERYLIPALRLAGSEANKLIAELEELQARASQALREAAAKLHSALEYGSLQSSGIFDALEQYCSYVLVRFEKEEKELLPLARRLLSIEEWFAIAARLMAEEAHTAARRRRVRKAQYGERRELPRLN